MGSEEFKRILPEEYHENTLFLLFQGPKILYAYWELSPGLKSALRRKKNMQIRLSMVSGKLCQTYNFDLKEKNHYFKNVQPGRSYYCEIGTLYKENIFMPLLRSNSIFTPYDLPGNCNGTSAANSPSSTIIHKTRI
ncbi:MAG: DUF4912 domain-containing protein [Peptococcaceae bacterium]|nr:DUF4912 domain-containing protein [Candidatus Syntrophopropionicum ammoniitolerans]